jgi:hypothetical protein
VDVCLFEESSLAISGTLLQLLLLLVPLLLLLVLLLCAAAAVATVTTYGKYTSYCRYNHDCILLLPLPSQSITADVVAKALSVVRSVGDSPVREWVW